MQIDIRLPNQKIYRGIDIDSAKKPFAKGTLPENAEACVSGSAGGGKPITDFVGRSPGPPERPTSNSPPAPRTQSLPPPLPISAPDSDEEEITPIMKPTARGPGHRPRRSIADLDYRGRAGLEEGDDYDGEFEYEEEPRRRRRSRRESNASQLKGGWAPVAIEVIVTCCTGGVIGGLGVFMAGKGPNSLAISLTFAVLYFFLSALTCGVLFLLLLPIWCLGAFVKLIVDIVQASS